MNTVKRQFYRNLCYTRQKGVCFWCQKHVPEFLASLEHITPKCEGGLDEEENFAMACRECNQSRPNSKFSTYRTPSFVLTF